MQMAAENGKKERHSSTSSEESEMPKKSGKQDGKSANSDDDGFHATVKEVAHQKSSHVSFSSSPDKVVETYSTFEYERRNGDSDPLTASIVFELEKLIANLETFEVTLKKGDDGFGFSIIGMGFGEDLRPDDKLSIFVKHILDNSVAQKDGRIKPGDQIIEVNGSSMVGVTHKEAVDILKGVSGTVSLVFGRKRTEMKTGVQPGTLSEGQNQGSTIRNQSSHQGLETNGKDSHSGPSKAPLRRLFDGRRESSSDDEEQKRVSDLHSSDSSQSNPKALMLKLELATIKRATLEKQLEVLRSEINEILRNQASYSTFGHKDSESKEKAKLTEVQDSLVMARKETERYKNLWEDSERQVADLDRKLRSEVGTVNDAHTKSLVLVEECRLKEKKYETEKIEMKQNLSEMDQKYEARIRSLNNKVRELEGRYSDRFGEQALLAVKNSNSIAGSDVQHVNHSENTGQLLSKKQDSSDSDSDEEKRKLANKETNPDKVISETPLGSHVKTTFAEFKAAIVKSQTRKRNQDSDSNQGATFHDVPPDYSPPPVPDYENDYPDYHKDRIGGTIELSASNRSPELDLTGREKLLKKHISEGSSDSEEEKRTQVLQHYHRRPLIRSENIDETDSSDEEKRNEGKNSNNLKSSLSAENSKKQEPERKQFSSDEEGTKRTENDNTIENRNSLNLSSNLPKRQSSDEDRDLEKTKKLETVGSPLKHEIFHPLNNNSLEKLGKSDDVTLWTKNSFEGRGNLKNSESSDDDGGSKTLKKQETDKSLTKQESLTPFTRFDKEGDSDTGENLYITQSLRKNQGLEKGRSIEGSSDDQSDRGELTDKDKASGKIEGQKNEGLPEASKKSGFGKKLGLFWVKKKKDQEAGIEVSDSEGENKSNKDKKMKTLEKEKDKGAKSKTKTEDSDSQIRDITQAMGAVVGVQYHREAHSDDNSDSDNEASKSKNKKDKKLKKDTKKKSKNEKSMDKSIPAAMGAVVGVQYHREAHSDNDTSESDNEASTSKKDKKLKKDTKTKSKNEESTDKSIIGAMGAAVGVQYQKEVKDDDSDSDNKTHRFEEKAGKQFNYDLKETYKRENFADDSIIGAMSGVVGVQYIRQADYEDDDYNSDTKINKSEDKNDKTLKADTQKNSKSEQSTDISITEAMGAVVGVQYQRQVYSEDEEEISKPFTSILPIPTMSATDVGAMQRVEIHGDNDKISNASSISLDPVSKSTRHPRRSESDAYDIQTPTSVLEVASTLEASFRPWKSFPNVAVSSELVASTASQWEINGFKSASHWTRQEVTSWLKSNNLEHLTSAFETNEVDGLKLLAMKKQQFKEMEITGKDKDVLKKKIKELQSAVKKEKKLREKAEKQRAKERRALEKSLGKSKRK